MLHSRASTTPSQTPSQTHSQISSQTHSQTPSQIPLSMEEKQAWRGHIASQTPHTPLTTIEQTALREKIVTASVQALEWKKQAQQVGHHHGLRYRSVWLCSISQSIVYVLFQADNVFD